MTVPVFPSTALPGLVFPVMRRPIWDSAREQSIAGLRARYPLRTVPMWQWEVGFSFLRVSTANPEWQAFVSFFNSVYGGAYPFEYLDPYDYTVSAQSLGTGDSTTRAFQLVRTGPPGGGTFVEPVFAPSTITQVTVGTTASTAYTLSTGGIITFSTAAIPPNGQAVGWTGSYRWLCRFDDDVADLSRFMYHLLELKKLTFTSELL